MAEKIKYVQLEPAAFLADIDFQMMDAEQRGVYCSIIFYLYCNNGQIELSPNGAITLLQSKYHRLAVISGCQKVGSEWDTLWDKIAHKFKISGNILTHKRVTDELKRAFDFKEKKSEAGKEGMRQRWSDNSVITKGSKVKVSKVNITNKDRDIFEQARSIYPGRKRGLETEFAYFMKTCKDWREVLPLLQPTIEAQIKHRKQTTKFVAEWKDFKSWIYNRYWELQSDSTETPQQKQARTTGELEKKKQKLREDEEKYWWEQTTEEIQRCLKQQQHQYRWWLLREILEERKGAKTK